MNIFWEILGSAIISSGIIGIILNETIKNISKRLEIHWQNKSQIEIENIKSQLNYLTETNRIIINEATNINSNISDKKINALEAFWNNIVELKEKTGSVDYMEIPRNLITSFHFKLTTCFRGKLTTVFRSKLTTIFPRQTDHFV